MPRRSVSREGILDAATRVLEEKGPEAFTTNAIAKAGPYATGSVYKYFRTRDDVILTLLGRQRELFISRVGEPRPEANHEAELLKLFKGLLDLRRTAGNLTRLLDVEEQRLPLAEPLGVRSLVLARVTAIVGRPSMPKQMRDVALTADYFTEIIWGMAAAAARAGTARSSLAEHQLMNCLRGYLDRGPYAVPGAP